MTPLLRAEQAVLGAVLLDPQQLLHLSWLEPSHFYRPAHGALLAAMRTLHAAGRPVLTAKGEVPVEWLTDTLAEASANTRGLTPSYLHTLIAACPRPGHAAVYGRMVLEGAIHRTVTEHAVRLHHAAVVDAAHGEVEASLRQADVLAEVLVDLARRWGTDPRLVPPSPSPTAGTPLVSQASEQVLREEEFLLSVLSAQPHAMGEVVDWLRPGDFADARHGQLYRCLGALHHRGEPIDQLTVLWEAQRRGLLTDGTLTEDQVLAICDGAGAGSAEYLGEHILRSALTRTAAATAVTVRDLARIESLAPGRLINHALHALGPLDEVRARWHQADADPPPAPAAPRPAAPKRARAALVRSTLPTTSSPTSPAAPLSAAPATAGGPRPGRAGTR